MKKYYYLLILISSFCFAQSKLQREKIVSKTDVETLRQLSEQFNFEYLQRQERIANYLETHPFKTKSYHIDGVKKEIYDVLPNGEIQYYSTSNFNAARTARTDKLYSGGSMGLNIQGQGMYAYVWDGGSARNTHVEFPNGKVVSLDGSGFEDHATHVTGTIVAQGLTLNLRGLAFSASAFSYDWNNDYSEMASAAANGMLVSNHSYFIGATQTTPWNFGAYDTRARQFDQIAVAAPYYLAVASAGNDRNDYTDPVIGPYLNEKFGYNLIRGMHNAKNFLTVGAVNQVLTYTGPSSVVMSSFSSWGPTDDGRIKPEIVTKGVSVRSTLSTSDTASGILQGTSMAAPGITGVALLLQQYYSSLYPGFMRAATLKGLIMHSADEAGNYVGPDYEYGWGLVNAERAATIIQASQTQASLISELELTNSQTFTRTVSSSGVNPLLVSISWTDPAAIANTTNAIDPTTSYLINDLDVRVTKGTDVYFPWTLDPAIPYNEPLRNSDNFRDNFEKVQIDNPNGIYTITVTHKGSLSGATQKYSLIVSSANGVNLSATNFALNENNILLYPNPTNDILNYSFASAVDLKSVSISDVSGKTIVSSTSDLSLQQINVSSLSSGIYFVTFNTDTNSITKKFIKQ